MRADIVIYASRPPPAPEPTVTRAKVDFVVGECKRNRWRDGYTRLVSCIFPTFQRQWWRLDGMVALIFYRRERTFKDSFKSGEPQSPVSVIKMGGDGDSHLHLGEIWRATPAMCTRLAWLAILP